MKVKVLVFSLFMFIAKVIHAQKTEETPEHELSRLKTMPADTTRIATLIDLAEAYEYMPFKTSRTDTIDMFLKEARSLNAKFKINKFGDRIDILAAQTAYDRDQDLDLKKLFLPIVNRCKRSGDTLGECLAWSQLGVNIVRGEKEMFYKIYCFEQALLLAQKLKDQDRVLDLITNIARIHTRQGNFNLAEKELLQVINPEMKASYNILLSAYDNLSLVYIKKGDYQKALAYGLKAEETMGPAADSSYAYNYYIRIAEIHKDLGNLPESLQWAKKAYAFVVRNHENSATEITAKDLVVERLLDLGRPEEALKFVLMDSEKYKKLDPSSQILYLSLVGDCYHKLGKDAPAEKSYLEMIALANRQKADFSAREMASSFQHIGSFYLGIHRQNVAKPYLLQALKYLNIAGKKNDLKSNYLMLFQADSAAGNYQSAMRYLQLSNRLKDSIFNAEKNKQIQQLQISFDTEQKNKDINELQAVAKLQKLSLKNAEASKNWVILGSCLLLIVAVLLYRNSLTAKRNSRLIQKKNQSLQRYLQEKEWLIKEVHHRVKNNLHTLICLLESQAKNLKDDALQAIETSQNRIFAMSLIHQKLYRSDDVKTINMAEYIPELVFNLRRSFDISDQVIFDVDVAPVSLNVAYAIPFGLIINEAVTNAIKYAFPKSEGTISVVLYQYNKEVVLTIADNGIGMPFNFDSSQSLGIELMKGLSQDIEGEISIETHNGTRVIVACTPLNNFEKEVFIAADKGAIAMLIEQ
ncbi:Two-component sensor histidine kinase, contains HisKA and HATPase domains [Mucilaginibacter gossypiicola]|uniref:histidine kinase n=1 Tax=Mucilaginibacter gossypiicola TaxID=551995 RepID=A0A1H8NVS3_9SPHI|nr:histidine kinase dimerization/phosphoacceptor domain -containing protein [Mucilaginibacter gossypiicola]SEO33662.1 Two-component sensor histidine kinase, contains HisKA and HATPase domains [Mucilaginibacter gossypiicola]